MSIHLSKRELTELARREDAPKLVSSLIWYMEKLGITAPMIERQGGFPKGYISKLMAGERLPSMESLLILGSILELDLRWQRRPEHMKRRERFEQFQKRERLVQERRLENGDS